MTVHVVAGVMEDAAGRIFVSRRPAGGHLAGCWEFPGGKLEPGEGRWEGLVRELGEELGIEVRSAHPLIQVRHRYSDRTVLLDVWRIVEFAGAPFGREGQEVEWRPVAALRPEAFPPADVPVLKALRLPSIYVVSPDPDPLRVAAFLSSLDATLAAGAPLVQLRAKRLEDRALEALTCDAVDLCERYGSRVLVNAAPDLAMRAGAHGVHLSGDRAASLSARPVPSGFLLGVSCHDAADLAAAARLDADLVVLGPVRATRSHPGAPGMGWEAFESLVRDAAVPVYAIGGVGTGDVEQARERGGQGVAGIRAMWRERTD